MYQEFTVQGMSCGHCKKRVEAALNAIDGVNHVDVDLASGRVSIKCSNGLGLDVLATAVEEAGYIFKWEKEEKN